MESIGRRNTGTEVTQTFRARTHNERLRSELFGEDNAVIAGIGLGELRKFTRADPVESAAVDDHAADRNPVAADPLRRRMHDQIGAEFDRPAEIRCCKRIVDQKRNFRRMRDFRDLRNIEHLQAGIADGFADHEFGVRLDRAS